MGTRYSRLCWTERYRSHLHCVGLSTPCLPLGKERGLALAKYGCNKRLDSDFVDLIISNRFIQAVIKTECVPLNKLRQVDLDSRFIYNHRGKIHANIHRIFFAVLNLLPIKSKVDYTELSWSCGDHTLRADDCLLTSHQKKKGEANTSWPTALTIFGLTLLTKRAHCWERWR